MDGTILDQGTFSASSIGLLNPNPGMASISQSINNVIQIPSGADFLKVSNFTQWGTVGAAGGAYFNGTANANVGIEFFWQLGMAPGTGLVTYKASASGVMSADTLVSGGFTLYDPSGQNPNALPFVSAPVAYTAITNATQPVVTASNAGLSVGSIVRLSLPAGKTALADSVSGIDFSVGALTGTTAFTLLPASAAFANAPGLTTGTGAYSIVNYNPLFYPRYRYITNITQAVNAKVSTSVPHGLTPGQEVRFNIPTVSGMIQLNASPTNANANGIILTVIDDWNFTINVNTTSYTAFSWPTVLQSPSSFPIVIPIGEDTATSLSVLGAQVPTTAGLQIFNTNNGLLADSTVNTGFLGMVLGSGGIGLALTTPIIGPSGSIAWSAGNVPTPDTMYWVAGKSTYGGQ